MGRQRKQLKVAPTEGSSAGEQLALIEVGPENAPQIKRLAAALLRAKSEAQDAKEAAQRKVDGATERLREAVLEANLVPVDGEYRLSVDGYIITVTPRAAAVKVKEVNQDEADED